MPSREICNFFRSRHDWVTLSRPRKNRCYPYIGKMLDHRGFNQRGLLTNSRVLSCADMTRANRGLQSVVTAGRLTYLTAHSRPRRWGVSESDRRRPQRFSAHYFTVRTTLKRVVVDLAESTSVARYNYLCAAVRICGTRPWTR